LQRCKEVQKRKINKVVADVLELQKKNKQKKKGKSQKKNETRAN
jgi:hypothetical protein